MEEQRADSKKRCPAMVEAGIEDPESQEGIDFCIGKCLYDRCIAVEDGRGSSRLRRDKRAARAKAMYAEGSSIKDMAQALGVSVRTAQKYILK